MVMDFNLVSRGEQQIVRENTRIHPSVLQGVVNNQ